MRSEDLRRFREHVRVYVGVFLALLVATAITVAVSYVHFGSADSPVGNVTVALIIAGLKAVLVAGFFMHLISERKSVYAMLGVTGVFVLGLVGLTVFAVFDTPTFTQRLQPTSAHPSLEAPHVP